MKKDKEMKILLLIIFLSLKFLFLVNIIIFQISQDKPLDNYL